jgi:hypothetical protein
MLFLSSLKSKTWSRVNKKEIWKVQEDIQITYYTIVVFSLSLVVKNGKKSQMFVCLYQQDTVSDWDRCDT